MINCLRSSFKLAPQHWSSVSQYALCVWIWKLQTVNCIPINISSVNFHKPLCMRCTARLWFLSLTWEWPLIKSFQLKEQHCNHLVCAPKGLFLNNAWPGIVEEPRKLSSVVNLNYIFCKNHCHGAGCLQDIDITLLWYSKWFVVLLLVCLGSFVSCFCGSNLSWDSIDFSLSHILKSSYFSSLSACIFWFLVLVVQSVMFA